MKRYCNSMGIDPIIEFWDKDRIHSIYYSFLSNISDNNIIKQTINDFPSNHITDIKLTIPTSSLVHYYNALKKTKDINILIKQGLPKTQLFDYFTSVTPSLSNGIYIIRYKFL